MSYYAKYFFAPFILLSVFFSVVFGEMNMWYGFVITFSIVFIGDLIFGTEDKQGSGKNHFLYNFPVYLSLPLLAMSHLYLAWFIGQEANPGTWRLFQEFGGAMLMGLIVAGYGTSAGHELTHRVHDKFALIWGRWLMSLSLNADFSIEHVYGHHVRVGTLEDPATARKGESVYKFFFRSSIGAYFSAWDIELKRLKRKNLAVLSWHNLMITGHLMSLCWVGLYFYLGGTRGALWFVLSGVYAKFLFEVVNYIEHYGLTRDKKEPVKPHHSWNTNNRMSDFILFSLNRHSSHHERPMKKYWELDLCEQAPQLNHGYFASVMICLIPPMWFKMMDPKVEHWQSVYYPAKAN